MLSNMLRRLPLAILALASVSINSQPAAAQSVVNCADRTKVVEFLARQYDEKQTAVGFVNPKAVMELYAADSGTWTLIITDVSGRSCVILAGKSWESIIPVGPKA